MTLSSTTNKVAYAGNGSTTSFSVTFIYWEDSTVKVILSNDTTGVETTWVDGTQYTLSGGDGSTGTLTVDTSPTDYTPASGETLTIRLEDHFRPLRWKTDWTRTFDWFNSFRKPSIEQ